MLSIFAYEAPTQLASFVSFSAVTIVSYMVLNRCDGDMWFRKYNDELECVFLEDALNKCERAKK